MKYMINNILKDVYYVIWIERVKIKSTVAIVNKIFYFFE